MLGAHTHHREHKLSNLACRIVALLSAASLVACTSMRVVVDPVAPDAGSVSIDRVVTPNDVVVVTATDGRQTTLRVTLASADTLEGVGGGRRGALRARSDRARRTLAADAVKTGLLVVAIALGVYLLALVIEAAGTAALASNL